MPFRLDCATTKSGFSRISFLSSTVRIYLPATWLPSPLTTFAGKTTYPLLNKQMFPIYLVTAIVGGGLIVLSAIGGMGHHDLGDGVGDHGLGDHNVGHDASGDSDSHLGSDTDHADSPSGSDFWLPFFSLRFWTYAAGIFGLFGLLGTFTKIATEPTLAMVAGATGLTMGSIAAYAMRWAKLNEVNSSVSEREMAGVTGKVLVAPRHGEPGKVRIYAKGESIDLLAVPMDGAEIEPGEEVVVVGMEGQRAMVARFKDYVGE